jgi:hypothetical protein
MGGNGLMNDFLLFGFAVASVLLAYTTYKNYVLLQAEKAVTRGLKTALASVIDSKQKIAKPRKKK